MTLMQSVLDDVRVWWYGEETPTEQLACHMVGKLDATVPFASEAQLQQFLTRYFVFLSYRKDFTPLLSGSARVTSDSGWGCLIRSSQMLMAHCLKRYQLHSTPLSLFRDTSDIREAPFGLHALIHQCYTQHQRPFKPEYWSPSQGCAALQAATASAVQDGHLPRNVGVVVSVSGTLFAGEVESCLPCEKTRAATNTTITSVSTPPANQTNINPHPIAASSSLSSSQSPSPSSSSSPTPPAPAKRKKKTAAASTKLSTSSPATVLVLLPLHVTPASNLSQGVFESLSRLIQLPTCLGVVGGTRRRSYYIIGCNQRQLVYLDPHFTVQPALVDVHEPGQVVPQLTQLQAIPFWSLCPSLFMGFAVQSRDEWSCLRHALDAVPFVNVEDGVRPPATQQLCTRLPGGCAQDHSSEHESDDSIEWRAL